MHDHPPFTASLMMMSVSSYYDTTTVRTLTTGKYPYTEGWNLLDMTSLLYWRPWVQKPSTKSQTRDIV